MTEKGDREKLSSSDDKKKEEEETELHFLSSKSESINVDASTEDDPDAKFFRRMATEFPLPWDEIQLREHGLLDAKCHHTVVPQDEIRLHRTGLIDDQGQLLGPRTIPRHYPFDELALKHSGYLDSQCHHRTVSDLERQRPQKEITGDSTSGGGGVDDRVQILATPEPILLQDEEKLKSKIATKKLKPARMNIQGHLNIRQTNSGRQCASKTTRITIAGNVKSHVFHNG